MHVYIGLQNERDSINKRTVKYAQKTSAYGKINKTSIHEPLNGKSNIIKVTLQNYCAIQGRIQIMNLTNLFIIVH